MGAAFEVFANLLESVIIAQFYMRYLGCKEKYNKWLVAAVLVISHFVAVSIVNQISFFSVYGDYFLDFVCIAAIICLLKGSVGEKLFLHGLRNIFVKTTILLLYNFFHEWMVYDADGYMVFGAARVVMVLFVKTSEWIFYELLIRSKKREKVSVDNKLFLGLDAMVWTTEIAGEFLLDIYYAAAYGDYIQSEVLVVTVASLISNIVVYVMCVKLVNNNADLVKEKLKNAAYESRMKDVNAAIDLHRQTMKIRHDMKNELLKVRIRLEEQKVDEAGAYLEEILNVKLAETQIVFTENMLVDTVINTCMETAKNKGIAVDAKVQGRIGKIEEMDMAILLSNLLDNAIEAAEKTQEKRIEIRMENRKEYLCIMISNSYNGEIRKDESKLATTKRDKEFHGYGLSNVKDIVQKYNGNYQCEMQEKEFVTSVNLYIS
ncbi:MAG: GHKL domain-containing protein [Candidatus Gastranaerophilales bacterium]|nr:GHKL domain-containing protein [Candidatus Gastranaerophilales bacterium]